MFAKVTMSGRCIGSRPSHSMQRKDGGLPLGGIARLVGFLHMGQRMCFSGMEAFQDRPRFGSKSFV